MKTSLKTMYNARLVEVGEMFPHVTITFEDEGGITRWSKLGPLAEKLKAANVRMSNDERQSFQEQLRGSGLVINGTYYEPDFGEYFVAESAIVISPVRVGGKLFYV